MNATRCDEVIALAIAKEQNSVESPSQSVKFGCQAYRHGRNLFLMHFYNKLQILS